MDRLKKCLLSLVFLASCFILTAQADIASTSPIGYWKSIDKATGAPKSIIQIWQTPEHVLMGKVIKTYAKDRDAGTVILSGLKQHADINQWREGKLLDPDNGRTYSCSLRMAENGKKIKILGYIGIPLLGRSQTWERVDLLSE